MSKFKFYWIEGDTVKGWNDGNSESLDLVIIPFNELDEDPDLFVSRLNKETEEYYADLLGNNRPGLSDVENLCSFGVDNYTAHRYIYRNSERPYYITFQGTLLDAYCYLPEYGYTLPLEAAKVLGLNHIEVVSLDDKKWEVRVDYERSNYLNLSVHMVSLYSHYSIAWEDNITYYGVNHGMPFKVANIIAGGRYTFTPGKPVVYREGPFMSPEYKVIEGSLESCIAVGNAIRQAYEENKLVS